MEMRDLDLDEIVTMETLATALGVKREDLRRWAREWGLPIILCGRRAYFHRGAVARWLKARETAAGRGEA